MSDISAILRLLEKINRQVRCLDSLIKQAVCEDVHECLGITPEGSITLFLNQRGEFTTIHDTEVKEVTFDNVQANDVWYIYFPYAATITAVTVIADQVGDIEYDVWADSLANFPPTVADTIVAAAPPTISGGVMSHDQLLTGWTTSVAANSFLAVSVTSVTDITKSTVIFTYIKA